MLPGDPSKSKKLWSPWFVMSPGGVTAGAPALSFVGQVVLSNSGSTVTSTTVNIGNPSYLATRRVIIAGARNNNANGPITGATINGVTATVHVDYEPGTGGNIDTVAIFSALVTSGTTNVTVTVTYGGSQFAGLGCAVYNVDNSLLLSTTPTTGSATSGASTVTSLATSAVSTSAGGFIIAAGNLTNSHTALAFTGMSNDAFGGTAATIVASGTTTGVSLTPTMTWVTAEAASVAAAAWR